MPPCLTLSIIRYGSGVKWRNPGKGVAPSPTPWCCSYSKMEPSGHPRLWSPTLPFTYFTCKGYVAFAIYTPLMMAHNRAEIARVTISHVSFINQFQPDTIKYFRQLENTYTKICRQNMFILFNEIYMYIYIYIYSHESRSKSSKSHPERRANAEHFCCINTQPYLLFFLIQYVKARAIPCPHHSPTRGDKKSFGSSKLIKLEKFVHIFLVLKEVLLQRKWAGLKSSLAKKFI